MAYSAITQAQCNPGAPDTPGWRQKIKENFDYLKAVAAAGGGSSSGGPILNGSFETDMDGDNIPDNWSRNLFNGGSGVFDTSDFIVGSKSYKIARPADAGGNTYGGGSLTSDYIECSFLEVLSFGISFRSSAANVINGFYIRFYDKDKVELPSGYWYTNGTGRELWKKSGSMPTTWTLLRILNVGVPIGVKHYKVAFHGGIADATHTYASAADIYIDRITTAPEPVGYSVLAEEINQAQVDHTYAAGFTDAGSTYSIVVPVGTRHLDVVITLRGTGGFGNTTNARAAIGTTYGTTVSSIDDSTWRQGISRINVSSLSGSRTLKFQAGLTEAVGSQPQSFKSPSADHLKFYSPASIIVDASTRTTSESI